MSGLQHHWDTYWQGKGGESQAVNAPGIARELAVFWNTHAGGALEGRPGARLLDLACGAGVVALESARAAQARCVDLQIVCMDIALEALLAAREGLSGAGNVSVIAGDAGALPFAAGSFDLVFSQFGVEYAGMDALSQAPVVLAEGGELAFLCHYKDGAIHAESLRNLRVWDAVETSGLLNLALDLLETAYAADEGKGSQEGLHTCGVAYRQAAEQTGALAQNSDGEAAQNVLRLLGDIAQLIRRRAAYDRDDARGWIRAQTRSCAAVRQRLQDMTAAALDAGQVQAVLAAWREQGFDVPDPDALTLGDDTKPGAWLLKAIRT
ncbi:class I SAM-dependent methyltransferase [Glycocaulis sp.]|uniref:class I SAM-dependent methyltransferase n=1 Tax=Glycocaulis sp. TaxID=1969725 RepID=UPI003D1C5B92